jgi:D-mannonate dehydratase
MELKEKEEQAEQAEQTIDEDYINKITLEYLRNPCIHIKSQENDKTLLKDVKFYKKRICQLTKDMTRGEFMNTNLQSSFNTYVGQLIYYFKQVDYKDFYQEEYTDLTTTKESEEPATINAVEPATINAAEAEAIDKEKEEEHHFIKKKRPSNLKNFVKKTSHEHSKVVLPIIKDIHENDPYLRTKGLKKIISKLIIND